MRFGVYRPAFRTEAWLERFRWFDVAGERWWPIFGAVYFMVAVKRVRGLRLRGAHWRRTVQRAGAWHLRAHNDGNLHAQIGATTSSEKKNASDRHIATVVRSWVRTTGTRNTKAPTIPTMIKSRRAACRLPVLR